MKLKQHVQDAEKAMEQKKEVGAVLDIKKLQDEIKEKEEGIERIRKERRLTRPDIERIADLSDDEVTALKRRNDIVGDLDVGSYTGLLGGSSCLTINSNS